ncbi:Carboxymuconolactone decarboxylase [Mycena kentingensis (nom. inval.)]|nr:Carboxymuconolactone decarboxylase [Mycena kentingensis (nom. inval.)]
MAPNETTHYGHIHGVPVGTEFESFDELRLRGVHRTSQSGIHINTRTGTDSVVLSGEYADDDDRGSQITYVGHGRGRNQTWKSVGNRSLQLSANSRNLVRVIRGWQCKSRFAPASGYRYDGLYRASNPRIATGKNGFDVCLIDLTASGLSLPSIYSHLHREFQGSLHCQGNTHLPRSSPNGRQTSST